MRTRMHYHAMQSYWCRCIEGMVVVAVVLYGQEVLTLGHQAPIKVKTTMDT